MLLFILINVWYGYLTACLVSTISYLFIYCVYTIFFFRVFDVIFLHSKHDNACSVYGNGFFFEKKKPKSSFLSISRFSYSYLNSFGVLIYFNSFIYKNNSKRKQEIFFRMKVEDGTPWITVFACKLIEWIVVHIYLYVCASVYFDPM